MIALTRRSDAATAPVVFPRTNAHELWREAVHIRQEWLDHGLSTEPADRATAEHSLARIYARITRPRPRFAWVASPYQAMGLIGDLPTLDALYEWIRAPRSPGKPPLASDLAAAGSRLRGVLSAGVAHGDPELSPSRQNGNRKPWPELPPLTALDDGIPLGVVLHRGVRRALYRSLGTGFFLPVRAALAAGRSLPVCWYGQQDASWIAYYDALRRLGLARYGRDETEELDDWATVARCCGWWWPGEDLCVVVERPRTISTEPWPGARHDEAVARHVVYRDGWQPRLT